MKRILLSLLTVALLAGTLFSFTSCGDVLGYSENWDGTSSVSHVEKTNVKKLVVPESADGREIVEIISEAFKGCEKLESISIPSTVRTIGSALFLGCTSLTSITVDEDNPVYHSEGNCIIETATNTLVAGCKSSVIPNYVSAIGYGAFSGTGIEAMNLPDSIWEIYDYAFSDCSYLKSITIPKNVINIGDGILIGCSSLETIVVDDANEFYYSVGNCLMQEATLLQGCKGSVIPSGVVELGDQAFRNCTELESLELPNSLREIGARIFDGCTSLKHIYYADDFYMWNALDKEDNWAYNMPTVTLHCTDGEMDLQGNSQWE